MVHIWPRAARATRHVAVDAVSIGQSEVVAHGIPEADLVQLEFRLAWQAVQESACGRRPTGCDGGLGLGTNSWVSHEILLHDEGKGTLELKTGRLREVGDVGEVVVREAVDAAGITSAQNCKDAFVELVASGAKPLDDGDAYEVVR
jgi:hypothetical protein